MSSKSNLLKGQTSSRAQVPKEVIEKEPKVKVETIEEDPKDKVETILEEVVEIKEVETTAEVAFGGILDNAETAEESVFFINSSEQATKAEMADIKTLPDKSLTKELESRESSKSKEGIISELKRRKGLTSTATRPLTPSEVLKQRTTKLTPVQELEKRRKNVNG